MLEVSPARVQCPVDILTKREKMTTSYLTQGWRNPDVSRQLSITEQTVKSLLRNI